MGLNSDAVHQSVICVLNCYFTIEYYLCHTPMDLFVGQHGECIAQALHNFVLHVGHQKVARTGRALIFGVEQKK